MKKRSRFSLIRIVKRLGFYLFICFVVSTVFHSKISQDKNSVVVSQGLGIQFEIFSPAYAAFEDEYLFDEFDQMPSEKLLAGSTSQYFESHVTLSEEAWVNVTPIAFQMSLPENEIEDVEEDSVETHRTIAGVPEKKWSADQNQPKVKKKNGMASQVRHEDPQASISIGPIVAFKKPIAIQPGFSSPVRRPQPQVSNSKKSKDIDQKTYAHKGKTVSGHLELAGGIAFLGDLEVSWVVEDEEFERGQIWLHEGYYEVPVEAITGEIVISLYDENDRLVGEGIANLDKLVLDPDFNPREVDVEIRAIDTSLAGRVYNGSYINSQKPIEHANIILFGTDETSQTDAYGQYHFNNWKTSDSRTIALASKEGFWDSVYMIDSSQTHEVFLFPNDYMETLMTQLEDIGYDREVRKLGIVYGRVQELGVPLSEVEVSIAGYPTTYFLSYIAMKEQKKTAGNGLFTVVGLENGEHELLIRRRGQIIDRRIVVVEAGKVSPIVIETGKRSKKLKFFDPLKPNENLDQTGYRFFDGEEYLLAEPDGRIEAMTTGGRDPALLEFAQSTGDENNIFINRAKKFEQIPVVNTPWFQSIKQRYKLETSDGLAVGFINNSKEAFYIRIAETPPDDILYFDEGGNIIKPSDNTIPAGFILVGLEEGLHTLLCESRSGSEVFFTDMIYNNQQSVSVLYKNL